MADKTPTEAQVKAGVFHQIKAYGESSVPPMVLATLVTAQHFRPFKPLPMLFPPVLVFTSYLNVNGYKTDAAGISAAWSGLYLLLAHRRHQPFTRKFGARGIVRGATLGTALANVVAGGVAYTFGKRETPDV